MLVLSVILSLSLVHSLRLTEEVFYKADTLLYTPEFCSSLQATDFLHSIRPTDSTDSTPKAKAFKTLFDACRGRFLFDGIMAKNVIVPMLDTGNTEYLPLLLDQGTKVGHNEDPNPNYRKQSDPVTYNNLDLSSEIKSLTLHLFGVNLSPSPATTQFFFQVRTPDRALAYLFAYTHLEKEAVEEVRELLENVSNHVTVGEYADAKSIRRAIKLVDNYLRAPKTIGNHKVNLSVLKKEDSDCAESEIIPYTYLASIILNGLGIILGFGTMATIAFILWKKQQQSKVKYHHQSN